MNNHPQNTHCQCRLWPSVLLPRYVLRHKLTADSDREILSLHAESLLYAFEDLLFLWLDPNRNCTAIATSFATIELPYFPIIAEKPDTSYPILSGDQIFQQDRVA